MAERSLPDAKQMHSVTKEQAKRIRAAAREVNFFYGTSEIVRNLLAALSEAGLADKEIAAECAARRQ